MTTTHKEIYASAEESLSVMSEQKATADQLEVLRLIDEAGLNEQGVSNEHYVKGIVYICASLVEAAAREREACAQLCEGMHDEDRPGDYAAAIMRRCEQ